ncbi:PqqD family protein [Methanophagales archaeon]|nr:MAG: PqqD family protein [Methanophagales archaeon]
MSEELWIKCESDLTTTFLDGEGLVFDIDTRKYYVINETAAFLLKLLEGKQEGLALSSIKSLLLEEYHINAESPEHQGLESFIHNLERYGLVSLQLGIENEGDIKAKKLDTRTKVDYIEPKIEEEMEIPTSGEMDVVTR